MSLRPHEVRQAITTRISEMSVASGYARAGAAQVEQFREASEPMVMGMEPATRAHLAFFVDDRAMDAVHEPRGRVNDTTGTDMRVSSPMVVRFMFQIRPQLATKIPDWDAAGLAAVDVLRALLTEGWPDAETDDDDDFVIRQGARPISRNPDVDGWLVVEIQIVVNYTLSLASQA